MKVIESEKVVPLVRLFLINFPEKVADEICDCIQAIVDMHTIDAVPVVHGRWIEEGEHEYSCSECKCAFLDDDDEIMPKHFGMRYCSYCGAKMDEGGT